MLKSLEHEKKVMLEYGLEHEKKVMLEYGNLMILKLSCSLGKCAPLLVEVHCLE